MICIGGVPGLKRHFGGAGPWIFYMIHRGGRLARGSASCRSATSAEIQNVACNPFMPLISIIPLSLTKQSSPHLLTIPALSTSIWRCLATRRAVSREHCTRPGRHVLSIRLAVLMVVPKMVYLGRLLPTTCATTGPEQIPMRMETHPLEVSSWSMRVLLATCCALRANKAMRTAWSSDWSHTRFATAIYASPMVSSLKTSRSSAISSNFKYSRSNMSHTCNAPKWSQKKCWNLNRDG